mgnify:CR=1 FL=1
MQYKTFWACTACKANYTYQRWALKHLTTAHDGVASMDEFTPEYQQQLIDGHDEFIKRLQATIARVDAWLDINPLSEDIIDAANAAKNS